MEEVLIVVGGYTRSRETSPEGEKDKEEKKLCDSGHKQPVT